MKQGETHIDLIKIAQAQFPNTIQLDGFDEAIIGLSLRVNNVSNYVYSVNKIIICIMRDGNNYEEAVEHFFYNIKPLEDIDKNNSPFFYDDRPHFSLN
tara:strand:+ start:1024 stop:1317 length:294 start_codon:yes stop_codon:yes gene_type:complete